MSRTIVRILKDAGLDPVRIEARGKGIPDINYRDGWLENKSIPRWPVRGGVVRLDHYTPFQRLWHTRRSNCGGTVFVLLKVGQAEWLLFPGDIAAEFLGRVPKDELVPLAAGHWPNGLDKEEFIRCLSRN